MRRLILIAALGLAACTAQPAASYRLDVDVPVGNELHTFTVDHGLSLQDCRTARPDLADAVCVRES